MLRDGEISLGNISRRARSDWVMASCRRGWREREREREKKKSIELSTFFFYLSFYPSQVRTVGPQPSVGICEKLSRYKLLKLSLVFVGGRDLWRLQHGISQHAREKLFFIGKFRCSSAGSNRLDARWSFLTAFTPNLPVIFPVFSRISGRGDRALFLSSPLFFFPLFL